MKVSELLDYSSDRARMEEVLRALDVPSFAIKSPIVIDTISKRHGLALDELAFMRSIPTARSWFLFPAPICSPAPAGSRACPDKAYPSPDDLAKDVVAILREEIIALRDHGCDFVQLDEPTLSQVVFGEETTETFMCAALPNRRDPTDELEMAVRLMNETLDGIDGIKTWRTRLPGQLEQEGEVLLQGNYGPMLPYLTQMNIDRLVLECATPRAGEMAVFQEYANEKEIGLGVVNPRTDDVEPPEQIVARVKELLQYFDPDKIYLNPDAVRHLRRAQRQHARHGREEDAGYHRSCGAAAGRVCVACRYRVRLHDGVADVPSSQPAPVGARSRGTGEWGYTAKHPKRAGARRLRCSSQLLNGAVGTIMGIARFALLPADWQRKPATLTSDVCTGWPATCTPISTKTWTRPKTWRPAWTTLAGWLDRLEQLP